MKKAPSHFEEIEKSVYGVESAERDGTFGGYSVWQGTANLCPKRDHPLAQSLAHRNSRGVQVRAQRLST
jgi:hypothetical protein